MSPSRATSNNLLLNQTIGDQFNPARSRFWRLIGKAGYRFSDAENPTLYGELGRELMRKLRDEILSCSFSNASTIGPVFWSGMGRRLRARGGHQRRRGPGLSRRVEQIEHICDATNVALVDLR